jgi:hypothetical protein
MCATLHLSNVAVDRHTAFCKMDWSRGWTIWGLYSGQGKWVVSSPKRRERLWVPRNFLFNWCRGSFPGIRRSEHPSTTEVKNEWSDTSISPICFQEQLYIHLCCLDEASSYHSVVTFPLFLVWEVFTLLCFQRACRQVLRWTWRPEGRKLQLLSASPAAIRAMKLAEHVERTVHMRECVCVCV